MKTMRSKNTPFTTYRIVVTLLVLLGIFFMWLVSDAIARHERVSLAHRAATIAASLDVVDIHSLSASEADIGTPIYENLKSTMRRLKEANNDIRFVYIFVKRGDQIVFLVDSEDPADEENYSPPGQVYYEATPELVASFENGATFVEGPEPDRWGTWVSGLAPVLDAEGHVAAVAGLDISANEYYRTIGVYTAIPFLLTAIMITIALYGQRLRAKEEELFRTKFRFLSIASHELRSPLSGIVWGAENILSRDEHLDDKERRTITLIRDAARYMSDTVADILTASRLEADTSKKLLREVVDVVALIRDVARTLSFNAEKDDIKVVFERGFPEHLPYPADREKLRRIFSNLIGNAIKYSRPNSTVTISYGRDKNGYVFSVIDGGIGIPKEEQDQIFATYYRAKNAEHYATQGTGMGLYFTKELVELHGGRIWFESVENKGTKIHVFLPDIRQTSNTSPIEPMS